MCGTDEDKDIEGFKEREEIETVRQLLTSANLSR